MKKIINDISGNYLGTEINGKWWRRYRKNKMFARGNGIFWMEKDRIFFHRKLTRSSISILTKNITHLYVAKWHAGKWLFGYPILKIDWQFKGSDLCSGFFLTRNESELQRIIDQIESFMAKSVQKI